MRQLGGQPYQDIRIIVTYDSCPWDRLHLDTVSHWIRGNLPEPYNICKTRSSSWIEKL